MASATPKLKDIAAKLGMGVSTVSETLNNKPNSFVSAAKKKLIVETAAQMGYVPNRLSRGLRGLSTGTVGIIASLFSRALSGALISLLIKELERRGYFAILCESDHLPGREKMIVGELLARGVDGFLFDSYSDKKQLDALIGGRAPYLVFNREFNGPCVTTDRKKGAAMVVSHLVGEHGRNRVAFVTSLMESNKEKLEGYKAALKKHGVPYDRSLCAEIEGADPGGLAELLLPMTFNAVFATDDVIAVRVINALAEKGLAVPDDIAVAGFDGLDLTWGLSRPSLTSARQPIEEVAGKTADIFVGMINGSAPSPEQYYIAPSLRLGRSCGCGRD
jgi:DNA-binding LacI/PurR family transcriptional regulator